MNICKNFWCKSPFVNGKDEYYNYCQYCRSSDHFQGQTEVVKESMSLGYSMKELVDILNNKKKANNKK